MDVEEPLPRPEWGARLPWPSAENCLERWKRRRKTLSERELEVELGAEAPAGSPLTLSETVPLKPVPAVTVAV